MTINLDKCRVRVSFVDDEGVEQLVFSENILMYGTIESDRHYRLESTFQLQEEETNKCVFSDNHKVYRICPHCFKELTERHLESSP